MAPILDLDLTAGRMVNQNDEENRSQVGVIGTDVVDNLFPTVDPLGKEIRVEGEVYRVIGVGKKQGTTLGQSRDNYVAIPITTYLKQFGSHTSIRISGKAQAWVRSWMPQLTSPAPSCAPGGTIFPAALTALPPKPTPAS